MTIKTLNEGQKQVFDKLIDFLKGTENDTFILNGYAGTGKTFLMQELAKYLQKEEILFEMLATTGRAASILKGKTGITVKTIHSAIYKFDKLNGADEVVSEPEKHHGQMFLNFGISMPPEVHKLIIIDEASMLSDTKSNQDEPVHFGTGILMVDLLNVFKNCKIIFVGDAAQLPPVGQHHSPALDRQSILKYNRKPIGATLSQIMRTNSDNDILEVASSIRQFLFAESNTSRVNGVWPRLDARDKNNLSIHSNMESIFNKYIEMMDASKKNYSIAIVKSNKVCFDLNLKFRKMKYSASDSLKEGEILLVTQNNYLIPVTNGDFVLVVKIISNHLHQGLSFSNLRVRVQATDEEYEILVSNDSLFGGSGNLTTDQMQTLYKDFTIRQKNDGVVPNSDIFKDAMFKDRYLNSLRCTFGYFITCHKAQGGEWENVFILGEKMMTPAPNHETNVKWWYTALTRAKERIYLNDGYWIKSFKY